MGGGRPECPRVEGAQPASRGSRVSGALAHAAGRSHQSAHTNKSHRFSYSPRRGARAHPLILRLSRTRRRTLTGVSDRTPKTDAPLETESDHGPTRTATRTALPAQRRGAAASPARLQTSPRLRSRPAPPRGAPQPAARSAAAAAGTHVPGAPPAPSAPSAPSLPSSLPRPGQAGAGRTLDRPWHRPSHQDGRRASRAGTPGRYACSGKGSVATDLAPGGTEATRLPHTGCGQLSRDTKFAKFVGHLCGSCRCAPGDLSANLRPLLPGTRSGSTGLRTQHPGL